MIRLANFFALGCLAGGFVVSLLSCFVVRDADVWFPFVWAGYGVVGCIWAALYGPLLKVLGIGRREITSDDGRRAFLTAAICALSLYLIAAAARTHQYDRILLFTLPFCAAVVDVVRVRATNKTALNDSSESLTDR